jgi:hypothetical protein
MKKIIVLISLCTIAAFGEASPAKDNSTPKEYNIDDNMDKETFEYMLNTEKENTYTRMKETNTLTQAKENCLVNAVDFKEIVKCEWLK